MKYHNNKRMQRLEEIQEDVGPQQMCVWYYKGEYDARTKNIPYWQRPEFLTDYMINQYEERNIKDSTAKFVPETR